MYPLTYYETFMRYEASNEVFVAMPFSPSFKVAYELVIDPAIRDVKVGGMRIGQGLSTGGQRARRISMSRSTMP